MDIKKTFWEKVKSICQVLGLLFCMLGCVLSLVLFPMLFLVIFNDSVEIFAKRVLGAESKWDVVAFIIWSMVGICVFLSVVVINNSVVAQAANYSMEKVKKICRELATYLFVYISGVGLLLFFVLFAVILDERVEYRIEGYLGVVKKWEVIQYIGLGIAGVLGFLSVVSVIRWVVVQVENNTKKMKEIWRKAVIGFLFLVGILGLLLFAMIFVVMFNDWVEYQVMTALGVENKRDIIESIGLGIAGILGFFGAIAVNRRADAQSQTAKAQAKNNELIERGYRQERFKTAVEHLGSVHESVRVASFYEFSYLARDNEDLRRNIFDILCAHLRQTTAGKKYKEEVGFIDERENIEVKPTEEVQSLLGVLLQSRNKHHKLIFAEFKFNLRGVFLVGARLRKMNFWNASLREADLQYASFRKTNLRGADLRDAILLFTVLAKANLQRAKLQGANLQGADLWDANLQKANLRGANLYEADLHDADLRMAHLQGADLQSADLQGVDLRGADLQRVRNLETAKLSGAKVKDAVPPEGFQWPVDVDTTTDADTSSDD